MATGDEKEVNAEEVNAEEVNTEEVSAETANQMKEDAENQRELLQKLEEARKVYNDNYVSPDDKNQSKREVTRDMATFEAWTKFDYTYLNYKARRRDYIQSKYGYIVTDTDIDLAEKKFRKWCQENGSRRRKLDDVVSEYRDFLSNENYNRQVQDKKKKRAEAAKQIRAYWDRAGYDQQKERKRWNEAGRANAKKNMEYFKKRIDEIKKSNQASFQARKYVKAGKEFKGEYGSIVTMTKEEYLKHCQTEAARWEKHYKNLDWGAKDAEAKMKKLEADKAKSQTATLNTGNSGNPGGGYTGTPDQTTPATGQPQTNTGTPAQTTPATGQPQTNTGTPAQTTPATGQSKEKVLQDNVDGNKIIEVTDANGNVSYVIENKDGKKTTITKEEIGKTNVKAENIQEAIQKGDWKKLLELLLKAIGERDQQASKQQLNDGQGAQPGSTASQPNTETTPYKDGEDTEFKVIKQDGKITEIFMKEKGKDGFTLTAEQLQKAGVNPVEIETYLKDSRYADAGGRLVGAAYKTGVLERPNPELEVKGNDIVFKDQLFLSGERDEPFTLNEQYLIDKCGMKKGKAEKTMENLRDLVKSDKTNQGAAYIIASYFANEKPMMPKVVVTTNYSSPKIKRNPGGKAITIKVKDSKGKDRELGYKEFAEAFKCSDEEAKKLRKECMRAIKNGGNVDGVLSFVANNSKERSYFWTNTGAQIGTYVVGAAAVGVGAYAVAGGFKKKSKSDDSSTTETVPESKSESEPTQNSTTTATTVETTRNNPTNGGAKDPGTPNLFSQMNQHTY